MLLVHLLTRPIAHLVFACSIGTRNSDPNNLSGMVRFPAHARSVRSAVWFLAKGPGVSAAMFRMVFSEGTLETFGCRAVGGVDVDGDVSDSLLRLLG